MWFNCQQEYIPVGCVPPTLYHTWGLPRQRPPAHRPLHRDPLDRDPSLTETPALDRDPPCRQTDTCGNITLPQTSFVDGKNYPTFRLLRLRMLTLLLKYSISIIILIKPLVLPTRLRPEITFTVTVFFAVEYFIQPWSAKAEYWITIHLQTKK